ncbi:hypothetical protein KKA47_05395 [bacterium]|nr:hypothetical protein [bacterium]
MIFGGEIDQINGFLKMIEGPIAESAEQVIELAKTAMTPAFDAMVKGLSFLNKELTDAWKAIQSDHEKSSARVLEASAKRFVKGTNEVLDQTADQFIAIAETLGERIHTDGKGLLAAILRLKMHDAPMHHDDKSEIMS